MKRIFTKFFLIVLLLIVLLLIPLQPLQGQETPKQEETAERKLYFLPALGFNLASNAILHLALRYVAREPWSMISFDSIKTNFSSPWQWDIDEYIINQFGHPYQGSLYQAAALTGKQQTYTVLISHWVWGITTHARQQEISESAH